MSNTFIAVDVETANNDRASVCSIGMAKFVDGELTDTWQSLVRPHPDVGEFLNDPWHVQLHGIDAKLVEHSGEFAQIWPSIASFVGQQPLVAHNAHSVEAIAFQRLFNLYQIQGAALQFGCSMQLAKSMLKLPGYRLPFVAESLGIAIENHHNALADAVASGQIVSILMSQEGSSNLSALLENHGLGFSLLTNTGMQRFEKARSASGTQGSTAKDVIAEYGISQDRNGPLAGKTVAISGTLSGLTKADAWKMICDAGGTPVDSFTGLTNCLILGTTEFANYRPGGQFTNKMKAAIARIEKGEDVEVFDQQELFDRLQATS